MEFEMGRNFLFRVPEGEDFIKYVQKFAEDKGIKVATVSAIGSLKRAKLGYYSMELGKYEEIKVEGLHELIIAAGNISIRDGEPFPHVHALLGREEGSTIGGHLISGEVFVVEVYIAELKGEILERVPHGNLTLWKTENLSN